MAAGLACGAAWATEFTGESTYGESTYGESTNGECTNDAVDRAISQAEAAAELARSAEGRQRLAMDLLAELLDCVKGVDDPGAEAAAWCECRRAWALEHGVSVRPCQHVRDDGAWEDGVRLESLPPRVLQRGRKVKATWTPGACKVSLVSASLVDPRAPAVVASASASGTLAAWPMNVEEGNPATAAKLLHDLIARVVPNAVVL